MKSKTLAIFVLLFILINCSKDNSTENKNDVDNGPFTLTIFNEVLYYDGYAATVNEPVPDGILRISNSKYATKFSESDLQKIGNKLNLEIIIKAACDNYDRIGNVFLSFINKGTIYNEENVVKKIEVARFITPFMDKNKTPNEVPYSFEINNVAKILTDSELKTKYDFWMEFDIFGVPYAANTQIAGCAGKNYTFYGTLKLNTSDQKENSLQFLESVTCFDSLNNFKNTDVIGKTIRTFNIDVLSKLTNAAIYLITSNHGSNAGGEEYIRRNHYVYFDENLIATYKPGGKSCEPFRQYNTQGNGIYGSKTRTETEWTSWNNWCPGDVIPIRTFELGSLEAGIHTFKIEVPEAKFVDAQGNFPLSAYIQGDK
ncbi:MAG: hypothetical protein IPM32_05950 [Ignavibacteriae bacterium]|nr:hypothetical protein [Ignavibacteriota bacterium]